MPDNWRSRGPPSKDQPKAEADSDGWSTVSKPKRGRGPNGSNAVPASQTGLEQKSYDEWQGRGWTRWGTKLETKTTKEKNGVGLVFVTYWIVLSFYSCGLYGFCPFCRVLFWGDYKKVFLFFLMFKSFFPWDRLSSFGCPYLLCEMSSLISFRSHYHEFSTPPRNTCLFRLKGGGGGGFVWGNNGILLWWSGFLSLCLSSFIYLKYAFFTFTTCISHLVSCFNYYALPKMGDGSVANIFH